MSISRLQRNGSNLMQLVLFLMGILLGIGFSLLFQYERKKFYEEVSKPIDLSATVTVPSHSYQPTADYISPYFVGSNIISNDCRILCLVISSSDKSRSIHIRRTWGMRCHKLVFSNIHLEKQNAHSNSWSKTRAGLQHIYNHFYREYDWFLKVQDDTFVVMENLHHFLADYLPKTPIYFGNHFWEQGNPSGGAGYIISKAALQRFMTLGHGNSSICSDRNYGIEHIEISRCFRNVGVVAGDSRDEHGLARLSSIAPYEFHKMNNKSLAYFSNSAIAFHYSNSRDFYVLEYIIYKLRPFGLSQRTDHSDQRNENNSTKIIYEKVG